jgi:hypothetical protein
MDGWTDKLVTVHGSHPSHPPSRNHVKPIQSVPFLRLGFGLPICVLHVSSTHDNVIEVWCTRERERDPHCTKVLSGIFRNNVGRPSDRTVIVGRGGGCRERARQRASHRPRHNISHTHTHIYIYKLAHGNGDGNNESFGTRRQAGLAPNDCQFPRLATSRGLVAARYHHWLGTHHGSPTRRCAAADNGDCDQCYQLCIYMHC